MILHELLNYDTLRLIWWVLLGVLLVGFAVMGGFDLGTGALLPFIARTDTERRVVINAVGPTWEGNQVWLILGGGAIFAAWPQLYAVSFSGFYLAMFLLLVALIVRPVAFKYRSKRASQTWRQTWDWLLFFGGFVPALLCGVAVGNVLLGVPFRLTPEMYIFYEGSFFDLLNPFALLCGLLSVSMLVAHGAAWLRIKTEGAVAERARVLGSASALVSIALYAAAGVALWYGVQGYTITSPIDPSGPSNPLFKSAAVAPGAWLQNYRQHGWTMLAPAAGFVGLLLAFVLMRARRDIATILATSLGISGIVISVGASMFPFILPSTLDPRFSLTVWDSSSSHLTLFIMLVCTLIFMPLIIAYTAWVYRVLWGKVDVKAIENGSHHAY
ncbi:cytochrome d ubiquinol oxidase subunit II [Pseudomonas qingdaonensis]|uniref:Cytochrome d ubiquinol oxidase subunit II n=1 Tax=Pseudomonas qingdaonensis TaxID=2056231 RepID=A0ABX8DVJ7_9PSED|nr:MULTISPECIES: cytochrome d ubiquinol oxidase subunit II [Pseudomonas]MDD1954324.1 cytochrome d ubiquinol oxidase subunit II [Pseudomonas sp. 8209]QVL20336.1 cytochrome d ubiquinol oxidase subunit II [Pseudomonas qingdaonensis]